jgi:signal transduction histidine kinase/DNA-binding NarL/FixJ family response regulator
MLVFETRLHIITFLIILLELVFFSYQIVYYLSRPTDKKRLYYLILLYLLIQNNIISGLVPDSNLPINIVLQSIISYTASFAMVMYLPYYFYKAFDLRALKFHAYWGSLLFLFIPFLGCFAIPYIITGNLEASRRLAMIVPFFYAMSLLFFLSKAIQARRVESPESGRELTSVFIGVVLFVFLPLVAFFQSEIDVLLAPVFHFQDGSQIAEALTTNAGLLVITLLFIRQTIRQSRSEYDKLLDSEKKLQELNSNLVLKVQERTKELELANEQRTNTFINLAHETKTPLTLINNYLEEYIRKKGQDEELKIIKSNIEKLTQDIVNFFDLERIQKGLNIYDNTQITDFSQMLRDDMLLFKQYSSKKSIELTTAVEDGLLVKADPESLHRIVNNLIENAIKYTNQNGAIEVSLKCTNHKAHFSVRDNGIGIDPSLHDKIFALYYQIHSEKKNFQGMGMGLSIVKKIIDTLNGEIILVSDPQKRAGTEITVRLPAHRILNGEVISEFKRRINTSYIEPENLQLQEEQYDENKSTIMIVEDNIPLLNYMSIKLKEKYNVLYAISGNEALEKLKIVKQLDLIVSDVMMDDGDGFDFYNSISMQKRLSHIPFIFLTAKTNSEDKIRGLSLGAIDYISKPFHIQELIGKIDSVLTNLAEQREALIHHTYRTLLSANTTPIPDYFSKNHFEVNCSRYRLTSREKEIAQLIAKGLTYKEIANTLHVADKTVGKHIQNMFEKVNATNKVELVNRLACSLVSN